MGTWWFQLHFLTHLYTLCVCVLSCTFIVTSKYSGNAVRTTHLTGASTDMGIALGHILKGRHEEWWKVQMHGIAVVGFFIGGVLGFFAFEVRNKLCQAGGI